MPTSLASRVMEYITEWPMYRIEKFAIDGLGMSEGKIKDLPRPNLLLAIFNYYQAHPKQAEDFIDLMKTKKM